MAVQSAGGARAARAARRTRGRRAQPRLRIRKAKATLATLLHANLTYERSLILPCVQPDRDDGSVCCMPRASYLHAARLLGLDGGET